jgi:uncharacterized membrane protein
MEMGKILVSILVFLFSVFLFPTLNDAAAAYTGDLATVVHAFPLLFILLVAVFPIFFLLKEEK